MKHGLLAEFATPAALVAAAGTLSTAGYRAMDAYTPFPVAGLAEALGIKPTRIGWVVFICGLLGGAAGYFMLWYAQTQSYPLNIGGRPEHSWPAFIPITFELTILSAAIGGFVAFFIANHLPEPYHPLFNVEAFLRASSERFFLAVEASDPLFNAEETARVLNDQNPLAVHEIPS